MSEGEEPVADQGCPGCGRVSADDARFCPGCGLELSVAVAGDAPGTVADPLIGRVIADRYRIQSLLGRGGMGVVYKAEHIHIGKLMALKLLHGELARDRDTVKRFRREAEAVSRLSHPNTVQTFDFGRDQGLTYLAMEYLEGRDFGWVIQNEAPLSFQRIARICAQVCASVAEAHAHGIVHRDLKPENVMVIQSRDAKDVVKVLDFGLAKLRESDGGHTLTRAGSIIGTPYYMAPEHIRGEDVDARADIYSVGAMMYKAAVGIPPFWASTPMGVLTKHLTEPVIPPTERASQRDLPPEADAIILKAMEKDRELRYARMEDFRDALIEYLIQVGEAVDSGSGHLSRSASGSSSTSGRRRIAQVATRGDVDNYERRIRRRSWLSYVVVASLLAAAGAASVALVRGRGPERPPEVESEPNDDPAHANPLPRGLRMRGRIGKRLDTTHGDADVFEIRNPGANRHAIKIEVGMLPNIDLAVAVVRAGIERPVLRADSAGVGMPEIVPNFPLTSATYYLRVRERWRAGVMPTENISDSYWIRWSIVEEGGDDETEINDSLELANAISVGASRRGFIGWSGDIDLYCLDEDAVGVVAEVSAIPNLDVVLRRVDRASSDSYKIDQRGAGEGERSASVPRAQARSTCFEVSADVSGGIPAAPLAPYTLRVLAPEPGVESDAGVVP